MRSLLTPKRTENVVWAVCWLAAAIVIGSLLVILSYVFIHGIGAINWSFLCTDPQGGLSGEGGIRSALVGTGYIILLTLAIAAPIGIGAGIYLAEYAPANRLTGIIRFGIEALNGIPSIVFGLFGFALFVMALHLSFSILAGALTLSCLVLPTLIRTTEEAIKTVPRSYREAYYALGATRFQTIRGVVLPNAMPGLVTAIILVIGRAVEETACLYVTMGGMAGMPSSLLDGGRTLSLHVFYLLMETNAAQKAMGTAALLILIIVAMNGITRWLSGRWVSRMSSDKKS